MSPENPLPVEEASHLMGVLCPGHSRGPRISGSGLGWALTRAPHTGRGRALLRLCLAPGGVWTPARLGSRWSGSGLCPDQSLALSLCQCPVLSLPDVVKGLFVCCVFLDYVSLSQRFIPELVNFLLGILYIATPNQPGPGEPPRLWPELYWGFESAERKPCSL